MQCFSPYMVKNKHTSLHGTNKVTPVPCGQCINCKKRRSRHWVFRLNEEAKISSSAAFLTLTYENAPISINGFPTLVKKDYQDFMKRLRLLAPTSKKETRIKYYACGEYGSKTYRPHYHAILFNLPHNLINNPTQVYDTWKHGHIMIAPNNEKTTNYVAGYITKQTFERRDHYDINSGLITADDRQQEFSLMSKNMGLSYLTPEIKKFYRDTKTFVIVKENGELISMPRYYKNHIFTSEELTQMYKEYINIIDEDIEQEINNIGSDYFKRHNDQIKALLRKTKINNNLKRQTI